MKISLIHPSRGRAQQARATYQYWLERISNQNAIEHILSIDLDDPQKEEYQRLFTVISNILIGDNKNCVTATNAAARACTGDIILYLSDDFQCPPQWDATIVMEFEKSMVDSPSSIAKKGESLLKQSEATERNLSMDYRPWTIDPLCLQVQDGINDMPECLTIPIMNRALYNLLGYFFYPEYESMYCDNDLYCTCMALGCLVKLPHITFHHQHWLNGKAPRDITYNAHDNPERHARGRAVFMRRQREGFLNTDSADYADKNMISSSKSVQSAI